MLDRSQQLERYTAVAVALHWAIAVLILFNLGLGFFMEGFPPPYRGIILPMHMSSGITVLALSVARIAWRITHHPPEFSAGITKAETFAAHTVHYLLYAGMIIMPLTGWSIISAHPPHPGAGATIWWGLFHLPPLGPVSHLEPTFQKHMHGVFVQSHTIGGYIMVALLLAHVAGALKHQFLDGHREFARMAIPVSKRG